MILFLDTETTGLPKSRNAPPEVTDMWPRMVSVAWISSLPSDTECEEHIIKPDGYTIPTAASNVHGITTKHAMENGKDIETVMQVLADKLKDCSHIACYNVQFDKSVLLSEAHRMQNWTLVNLLKGIKWYCVMKRVKNHLSLKNYIKLSVAHGMICCEMTDKTYEYHNAGDDVLATRDIMFSILGEV